MPLPQEIQPVNSELMDSLCKTNEMEWIPMEADPERGFMKILWTGSETGGWCVLFRWLKGYVAPPHKHLSPAHVYVLSGKLQVRDGTLEAGDYVYEPNGMVHGATTALEDTDYLFLCEGPLIFFDEDNFTSYWSWEEMIRIQEEQEKLKKSAAA